MASEGAPASAESSVEKLPSIPKHAQVKKRPLLHSQISSPYAGKSNQKIIYISSKTPFMAVIKRVQKFQHQIRKREAPSSSSRMKKRPNVNSAGAKRQESEPVILSATGKAVDKALTLALHLQQQPGIEVKLVTGSADAIDDIVPRDGYFSSDSKRDGNDKLNPDGYSNDVVMQDASSGTAVQEDTFDLPESRLRRTSAIHVYVTIGPDDKS